MLSSYLLFALPLLASAAPSLNARFGNEVVYISRCIADSGSNNQLEADYYSDIGNSQNLQTPNSVSQPQFVNSGQPNFNGQHSYFFPDSGVTFTYNAQNINQPAGTQVGTGSNGSPFTCFRDTDRNLYYRHGQNNRPCVAVLYCRKSRRCSKLQLTVMALGRKAGRA
ncbi:hypothetical protein M409DRAFT_22419 [Zasmidium cellare ATCC 36951]|uniref:Uncharacterized protein n=1 Tax=Zasmidium cellare ATCC 36951 TaxID=1080233 RepID=A0A6A6CN18_ZASCE|nr:uncharacterized protein M409DRAFT_22419 [Zasmidium cellare ATCC 36951]KAF2167618.1 hypothetical protein M409DRAFT_22419 [Zasmidium cellare ATCC 36951]